MKKLLVLLLVMLLIVPGVVAEAKNNSVRNADSFRLLTTPENELIVKYAEEYCTSQKIRLDVTYMGDIDAINELGAASDQYDAVWLSNSMWMYRLDSSVSVTDSKSTGIVPVVVGIRPELYSESIKTIDDLMQLDGTFGIPSITRSDAGASSYLGIYYAISGSPRMLTMDLALDEEIRARVNTYIKDYSEIYSTYEDLEKLVNEGHNSYYFGYESDFIRLNTEHGEQLKLVYLEDGIPLADKPFAYVDNKNSDKKEIFLKLQTHLLKNDTQREMCDDGIRTGYGGQVPYAKSSVFNKEWGIDTQKYLYPINYPSMEVTTELLNFYTAQVSRPANYIFCLDFSGSMEGAGHRDVIKAMTTLFDESISSRYFIQMKPEDKVTIILFNQTATEGSVMAYEVFPQIPQLLSEIAPVGGTNIYAALDMAMTYVLPESSAYSNYVVLLTDGESDDKNKHLFVNKYNQLDEKFPIYSITMGQANEKQLKELADLSNGQVFNGKRDLVGAFKTLRGYN